MATRATALTHMGPIIPMAEVDARLWQLISPTLPIGAYTCSQGLEYAAEAGWVTDERAAREWILGIATEVLPRLDLPLLARMHRAWKGGECETAMAWNDRLLASRESRELLQEDLNLGQALLRLLPELEIPVPGKLRQRPTAYATAFALAAAHASVALRPALSGYVWAWGENQVAAAIKLVPLGQSAGQRILLQLGRTLDGLVERALDCPVADLGMTAPGLGIASARHETQHTRLFRS